MSLFKFTKGKPKTDDVPSLAPNTKGSVEYPKFPNSIEIESGKEDESFFGIIINLCPRENGYDIAYLETLKANLGRLQKHAAALTAEEISGSDGRGLKHYKISEGNVFEVLGAFEDYAYITSKLKMILQEGVVEKIDHPLCETITILIRKSDPNSSVCTVHGQEPTTKPWKLWQDQDGFILPRTKLSFTLPSPVTVDPKFLVEA